jgi:hypothetical protein
MMKLIYIHSILLQYSLGSAQLVGHAFSVTVQSGASVGAALVIALPALLSMGGIPFGMRIFIVRIFY